MLEAFLLYYVIGIPFLTSPISRPDFPVAVERLTDTSDIPLASNTYAWASEHEIRANIQLSLRDFMTTTLVLNPDGTVKEERMNYENSDSLFFVEKYQYQDGKLLTWRGSTEFATCAYANGRLDSIHMLYDDDGDSEEYYFKLRYDSIGRLSSADRMIIVPNNNPGSDYRIALDYEGDGTVTVKRFSIPTASDTVLNKVLLKDGRIHEILSSLKSDRTRLSLIRRFTYPDPAGISRGRPRPPGLRLSGLKGRDYLGRESARRTGFQAGKQPKPAIR